MADKTFVYLHPMQVDPADARVDSTDVVHYLDERIADMFQTGMSREFFLVTTDPNTDSAFMLSFLREVNLEIYSYQPHFIEAAICAIAQLPRSIKESTLKTILAHQAEEFSHGEKALRGYVVLGGDETYARNRRISPASFAVSALWRMLVHMRDPFMFMGALYLFERLSPTATNMAQAVFRQAGAPPGAMEFMDTNANEDIRHANLMRELVNDLMDQYPDAAASVKYGMECCLHVYPLPIWETAFEQAKARKP